MSYHKKMEAQRARGPRNPKRRTVHFISPRHGKAQEDYYGLNKYTRTRFGNLVKVKD